MRHWHDMASALLIWLALQITAMPAYASTAPEPEPILAAHWFGAQWPKNLINGYRREQVARDFAQLRADGFNTVILLVSWGDFQPVQDPCCRYDERAFERLAFLLDAAQAARLSVVLRIGYGWSFHPEAGASDLRVHRLLNEPGARAAFLAFVERIGVFIADRKQVRLSLLSWEDLWLHRIDPAALPAYTRWWRALPFDHPARGGGASVPSLPGADGEGAALFHAWWDWLLVNALFVPAQARLHPLALEACIDSDRMPAPLPTDAEAWRWIGHESTYAPAGAPLSVIYWAPFWGADNRGEQLSALRSLTLLAALLTKVRAFNDGLPIFIDQFNVVDNTPGYEHNAQLAPAELPAFMRAAYCTLREHAVVGYAWWTWRDYRESPLYNPSFAYGLDGWLLEPGTDPKAARLRRVASGDQVLDLRSGDVLSQRIPAARGRLPTAADARADRVCVRVTSSGPAHLQVSAGGPEIDFDLPAGTRGEQCRAIEPKPDDGLTLRIRLAQGSITLANVQLFDHVQSGQVHALDGGPEPMRPLLSQMNARWAANEACP